MRTFHLAIKGVGRSIGDHVIFSGLDLTVSHGERIGIVGPNGIGKSTLLRLLVGSEQPDEGQVVRQPAGLVVGHVAQEPIRDETTVRSALRARSGVTAAEDEFLASTEGLADATDESAERYDRALDRYLRLDVAGFEVRLADVVAETGLAERLLDVPLSVLSGGEAARVSLASVLLQRADVLCLDEPTNDLDLAGLRILTSFVRDFDGAVVLISHDRAFLDDVVTDVLELHEPDGRAQRFSGGWSAYLEERSTSRRHAEEAYAVNQTQRGELQSRARQQREWATKGVARSKSATPDNDKMQRDFRVNRTEKLASKARATDQALERLGTVEKPWEGWQLQFEINEHGRSGDLVASIDAAVIERGDFSLGPIDLTIGWGDRLAIVGPNGSGKSTLLRALVGEIPLTSGRVRLGPGVVVGELRQGRSELFTGPSLLRSFVDSTDLLDAEARSLLAKFGLGVNEVMRPPEQLSPGERTRAGLARFQAIGVNCLLLDEPTNHLDLPAIEQLEEALRGYGGTLIVVSHDRMFLEALALDQEVDLERR